MTTLDMTTLDIVAMCIGYFVMFIIVFTLFVIMPFAAIGKYHAERNARIYDREMRKRGIDPHIDPKFM